MVITTPAGHKVRTTRKRRYLVIVYHPEFDRERHEWDPYAERYISMPYTVPAKTTVWTSSDDLKRINSWIKNYSHRFPFKGNWWAFDQATSSWLGGTQFGKDLS